MTIERNEKLEDSLLEKMSSVDLKKTDNWNKAMILNSAVTAVSKKDLQEMIMI